MQLINLTESQLYQYYKLWWTTFLLMCKSVLVVQVTCYWWRNDALVQFLNWQYNTRPENIYWLWYWWKLDSFLASFPSFLCCLVYIIHRSRRAAPFFTTLPHLCSILNANQKQSKIIKEGLKTRLIISRARSPLAYICFVLHCSSEQTRRVTAVLWLH